MPDLAGNGEREIKSVFIVGGSGFLGLHLIEKFLLSSPHTKVSVFDLRLPNPEAVSQKAFKFASTDPRIDFYKGDITDYTSVRDAIAKAKPEVVVHSASPVHGLSQDIYYKVNVEGTKHVVNACLEEKETKVLVYTSSAGVVFDGGDLINVDESAPIPKVPMDGYNDSKAKGEKSVLYANCPNLLTCALRPAGLFGPGDRQLIPGLLSVLENGQTMFQIGNNLNLFDFTYIGNVADSHVLAAEKLLIEHDKNIFQEKSDKWYEDLEEQRVKELDEKLTAIFGARVLDPSIEIPEYVRPPDLPLPSTVAGEAFFITNGTPIYFWSMPRAVWAHKGHISKRTIVLTKNVGQVLGALSELFAYFRGKEASLTRFRVKFTCAHRYYNITKARKLLGYQPNVGLEDGIKETLAWLDEKK